MYFFYFHSNEAGQALSFSWEMSRRGTQSNRAPKNRQIFGKRRNRDRPMPQSGSQCDKRIPTRQRQCLTCSTHWSQHLLLQMHSMSITPECHSGILVYWFHLSACTLRFPCIPAICCVFASGLANNLFPILSSRCSPSV